MDLTETQKAKMQEWELAGFPVNGKTFEEACAMVIQTIEELWQDCQNAKGE